MGDVFISYSSGDRNQARQLAEALESRGFSVWWDRKIPPGRTYDEVIEEALGQARAVIVLWSEASVESDWVKTEAAEGAQRRVLVPALIEDAAIPLEFRRIQAADLIDWGGDLDAPGFRNLVNAVNAILEGEKVPPEAVAPAVTAYKEEKPESPEPVVDPSASRSWARNPIVWIGGAIAAVIVVVLAVVLSGGGDDGETIGEATLDPVAAEADLREIVRSIGWQTDLETGFRQLPIPTQDVCKTLPPLSEYPVVVAARGSANAVVVEVFSSSEKAGMGTDGWLVEVAEDFNDSGQTLSNGQAARVQVRRIPSGVGYEFIACREAQPQAFTPSNHLWIEMARARGVTMTPVREQLVANTAGIVLESETAERLETTFGQLDASKFIDAVLQGDVVMGYTDPFASSTGLNFLVTVLDHLSGGQEERMLDADVVASFEEFQRNVPFVALTTLQIRESVERGGQLDAFVMEYQTFIQAESLRSGFEFIPFGIAHDNPLYAVGNLDSEESEALELLAAFTDSSSARDLAEEYGFDPPPYTPTVAIPSGSTLIDAQQVWKQKKDGGRPVTAVFVADVSGSMQGTRISALRDALLSGIEFIGEENSVGLVEFDDFVRVVLEVGRFDLDQRGTFGAAVAGLDAGGGTAMYDGVAVGLSLLLDSQVEIPDAKPILIVLTDGETTAGHSFGDMEDIIQGLGIPVYTIGFEADLDELARLSSLVEAASINASEENVQYKLGSLFNAQL